MDTAVAVIKNRYAFKVTEIWNVMIHKSIKAINFYKL